MLKGFKIFTLAIIVALSGLVVWVAYELTNPKVLPPNVHLEVETDKESYGIDENVNITVKIINDDYDNATFYFDTDYQYDLIVYDSSNNEVFNLFENFTIYNTPTNIILPSKSEKVLLEKYTWNRADKNGRQVQPGNYRIYAKLVGYDISDEKQISIGEHREVYIKVTTDKNAYRIGENVSISAYVVNEMDVNLIFWGGDCGMDYSRIYDSTGKMVFEAAPVCPAVVWNYTSKPNSEWDLIGFIWDQTNYCGLYSPEWYSQFYDEGTFTQVPPDMYRIPFLLKAHPTIELNWNPVDGWPPDALGYKVVGFKTILIV